ncbi:hypothetical protein Lesp02_68880 [Lentzea sp. NBRC 105346]|uniref:hypothetical protein n=1 Tax=Lentzea sp. NBRC 105346 TaxID=3032205 RepID=UPI0024A24234|nr:hypothetical protein [Lentzea sp. NBRC 105346]GLZ34701.1 hypothetical protein Lesp02_68880 [Lentzea sp. NBRC 105346]
MVTLKNARLSLLIVAVGTLLAVVLVVLRSGPAPSVDVDPDPAQTLASFTLTLTQDASYATPPSPRRLGTGVLDGSTPSGFARAEHTDPATGRRYAVVSSDRGWGLYLIDLSAPTRLAIEVPHANSDLDTEQVGLGLFRKLPGSVLLVTGTHRKVVDVAHEEDTVFNAVARLLAERSVPQVQVHGFDDESLPSADVVLSSGAAPVSPLARAVSLEGFDTCRAWESACGKLEGTKNVQGQDAAALGATFLHVELSRSVRSGRLDEVVSQLAKGLKP